MSDVVHFYNGISENVLCGEREERSMITWRRTSVTCPDCLEKIGVMNGVDEEKIEICTALAEHGYTFDNSGSWRCKECCKATYENKTHNGDCAVGKAEAYLKSVKGE